MGATVSWSGGERNVNDEAELLDLLDEIEGQAADSPDLVDILPDGAKVSLTIGLGRGETVLSLTPVDGNPPFYASRGDSAAEGTIDFLYFGAPTEFPRWQVIPTSVGKEIAAAFVTSSDRRSTRIDWAEVSARTAG